MSAPSRRPCCGRVLGYALLLGALAEPAAAQEAAPDEVEAAPADARLDEARARLARGQALYDAGDLEGAWVEFGRVELLLEDHPLRPLATYNRARTAERLFRYDEALALYEAYLAAPDPDARFAEAARAKLEALAALLGTLRLEVELETRDDAPAVSWEVWVDGRRVARDATEVRVPGGRHRVEVRAEGRLSAVEEVEVASGRDASVRLRVRLPARSRGLAPEPFAIALASAGVLALVAAILGPVALAERERLEACLRPETFDARCWVALEEGNARVAGLAIGADVSAGLALAAAVAATVLGVLTDFGGEPHEPGARVVPLVGPTLAGLALEGRTP